MTASRIQRRTLANGLSVLAERRGIGPVVDEDPLPGPLPSAADIDGVARDLVVEGAASDVRRDAPCDDLVHPQPGGAEPMSVPRSQ